MKISEYSFLSLAEKRYSLRDFSSEIVEDWKIDKILKAASLAPTAVNNQPQKIYLVKDPVTIARINKERNIFGASILFVVCYDDSLSWKNAKNQNHDSGEVDAAIVATHMMLEATDLSLGTCYIGSFNPEFIKNILSIPSNIHPIALIPTGYPAPGAEPSERHNKRQSPDMFTVTII